jgi:hypothetical protein
VFPAKPDEELAESNNCRKQTMPRPKFSISQRVRRLLSGMPYSRSGATAHARIRCLSCPMGSMCMGFRQRLWCGMLLQQRLGLVNKLVWTAEQQHAAIQTLRTIFCCRGACCSCSCTLHHAVCIRLRCVLGLCQCGGSCVLCVLVSVHNGTNTMLSSIRWLWC